MVHLPEKRALSCAMKIAATMRGGPSVHARVNGVRCRTCDRRRAEQAAIAPRAAALTVDYRNSCARIWCVMPLMQSAIELPIAAAPHGHSGAPRRRLRRVSFWRASLNPCARRICPRGTYRVGRCASRPHIDRPDTGRVDAEAGSIAVEKRQASNRLTSTEWVRRFLRLARRPPAQVAELVDALVSGTSGAIRGGSSPLLGTKFFLIFQ